MRMVDKLREVFRRLKQPMLAYGKFSPKNNFLAILKNLKNLIQCILSVLKYKL